MARGTGVGSMPGSEFTETFKVVLGVLPDLPHLPELPARGPHAAMIGRTLGLVTDLGADLQPDGWRVGVGQGVDQRRARSLLAQDLDVAEELTQELAGPFKIQVAGPLTLAATVERPRGDKMLADHGARRELAQAWTAGLVEHLADARRRFAGCDLVVQIDEPALRAVMDGTVPTASGYATHRRVDPPEVDALLRPAVEAVLDAEATPVVHSCAAGLPVALLTGIGFAAVSFDLALHRPDDVWAEALESGVQLWLGGPTAVAQVDAFLGALGFEAESVDDRIVVTPSCGLAGSSPADARAKLRTVVQVAKR